MKITMESVFSQSRDLCEDLLSQVQTRRMLLTLVVYAVVSGLLWRHHGNESLAAAGSDGGGQGAHLVPDHVDYLLAGLAFSRVVVRRHDSFRANRERPLGRVMPDLDPPERLRPHRAILSGQRLGLSFPAPHARDHIRDLRNGRPGDDLSRLRSGAGAACSKSSSGPYRTCCFSPGCCCTCWWVRKWLSTWHPLSTAPARRSRSSIKTRGTSIRTCGTFSQNGCSIIDAGGPRNFGRFEAASCHTWGHPIRSRNDPSTIAI